MDIKKKNSFGTSAWSSFACERQQGLQLQGAIVRWTVRPWGAPIPRFEPHGCVELADDRPADVPPILMDPWAPTPLKNDGVKVSWDAEIPKMYEK